MKKISIMDYKKRLQEVRKNKPNNLVIRRKLEIESRRRSQELENKPQQEEDADNIKKIEQKTIINKVNPEFIGIASSYGSAKKQRIMSQQLLESCSHEYSTIDKINKSL